MTTPTAADLRARAVIHELRERAERAEARAERWERVSNESLERAAQSERFLNEAVTLIERAAERYLPFGLDRELKAFLAQVDGSGAG